MRSNTTYVSQGVEFITSSYTMYLRQDDNWIRRDDLNKGKFGWKCWDDEEFAFVNCTTGPAIRETLRSKVRYKMLYMYHWVIDGKCHREDGPAMVICDLRSKPISIYKHNRWFVRDIEITDKVHAWIKKNKLPVWWDWTNKEKLMFKLKFV